MVDKKFRDHDRLRRVVLVKSCQQHRARQEACRATWAGELSRQGIPIWFTEGAAAKPFITNCWILTAGGDGYDDNSIKVRDAIALLLEYDPFDLLFVCDDDTFVQWRRWLDYIPKGDFAGLKTDSIPWVHGGGGWYMTRRACEAFVKGIKRRCSWDDKLATEILERAGFEFENQPDLFAQWDERVAAENRLITCHQVYPDEMPSLYESTHALR